MYQYIIYFDLYQRSLYCHCNNFNKTNYFVRRDEKYMYYIYSCFQLYPKFISSSLHN